MKPSTRLQDFKADVYSQNGEDGVIQQILATLPQRDHWCVEFGAVDGRQLSNTLHLIEKQDYSAVLIEGDKKAFRELQKNFSHNPQVSAVNRFVGLDRDDNLDHILQKTAIPRDFDFLSIDIDGNDYHAWKACTIYKPKVVCIEFNNTIPLPVAFVQPADPSVNQGCGLSSLVQLGKDKGYELISVLSINAFFVRSQYFPYFQIEDNRPETLWQSQDSITYLFMGYDGTMFLRGYGRLPGHGIELKESRIQHLPKLLRRYTVRYTITQRVLFLLHRARFELLSNPIAACKKILPGLKWLFHPHSTIS